MTIEGLTDDEYAFIKAQSVVHNLGPQPGEDDYPEFHDALNAMLGQANRWGQEKANREAENNDR